MSVVKKNVSIKEVRRHVFEQMIKLSDGKISIDEAFATNKLASTILSGYEIEKDMVSIAIRAGQADLIYEPEPISIENK